MLVSWSIKHAMGAFLAKGMEVRRLRPVPNPELVPVIPTVLAATGAGSKCEMCPGAEVQSDRRVSVSGRF
jgi:hypothetical protein